MLLFCHLAGRFSHLEPRLLTVTRITRGVLGEKTQVSTLLQIGVISLHLWRKYLCGKNLVFLEKLHRVLLNQSKTKEKTGSGELKFLRRPIAKPMTINISYFICKENFLGLYSEPSYMYYTCSCN